MLESTWVAALTRADTWLTTCDPSGETRMVTGVELTCARFTPRPGGVLGCGRRLQGPERRGGEGLGVDRRRAGRSRAVRRHLQRVLIGADLEGGGGDPGIRPVDTGDHGGE